MKLAQLLVGKTPQERVRICYRILERLRLRHNEVGLQFKNGDINEAQWKAFLATWEARHKRVYEVLNTIKENLNLFLIANETASRALKEEGKVMDTYDTDIDIDNIG